MLRRLQVAWHGHLGRAVWPQKQAVLTRLLPTTILTPRAGPGARNRIGTRRYAVDARRSVLIVDRSEETRQVLRTALERRGTQVLEAEAAGSGLELARRHHPDLIILDLEVDTTTDANLPEQFAHHSQTQAASLIVLGTARRSACGEFVAKPYHYGPLIRKIEELLASRSVAAAHVVSK
jgi:CheY-like chemotaxis protein